MSLLVQNGLLVLCAVVLSLMFGLDMGICDNVPLPLFISLSGLVILLGSGANLATVANTIAIEKDWIVVIADKNKDTLAGMLAASAQLANYNLPHSPSLSLSLPHSPSPSPSLQL